MFSDDTKKPIYEPSPEIETPKYSYQDIDTRTYSVDCCASSDSAQQQQEGEIFSLKNLSGLH
jgi:hypothetical protein